MTIMQSDLWNTVRPALTFRDRSLLEIAEIVTALLSITVISIGVYRVFFHPLAHIPGPIFAKLTHLWQTKSYFIGNWHSDILKVHEKYGPVVRISPDEISFVDGDALKRLYGHVKPCKKVVSPCVKLIVDKMVQHVVHSACRTWAILHPGSRATCSNAPLSIKCLLHVVHSHVRGKDSNHP
jgi:hypothetical protein